VSSEPGAGQLDHVENGFSLGNWARNQRDPRYPLSEDRRRRLDEIGFVWDTYLSKWQIGFNHLKSYRDRVGHCRVPGKCLENGYNLGSWVSKQRRYKVKLSEEQRASLETLGFDWDVFSTAWEKAFGYLSNYKDRNGDCRVPPEYTESGFALGQWVSKQRRNENNLSTDRRKKLDDLGFHWNNRPSNRSSVKWENGFRHLKAYKQRIGDCRVPFNHLENGYKLGRWVAAQRRDKNKLSEEQRKKLDQLAFDWDVLSTNWEKAFACLGIYKKRVGHCRVPKTHIENGIKLGSWVNSQKWHKETISEEQRKRLDEIGIQWIRERKKRPESRRSSSPIAARKGR
jgi:hypothetical protein